MKPKFLGGFLDGQTHHGAIPKRGYRLVFRHFGGFQRSVYLFDGEDFLYQGREEMSYAEFIDEIHRRKILHGRLLDPDNYVLGQRKNIGGIVAIKLKNHSHKTSCQYNLRTK